MQQLITQEIKPGLEVANDEALLSYFKDNCNSIYHLCGSCAMGPDASNSVVDAQLRVHGMQGLRVIDASVFPNITSGNINAATMMVAEKGADLVLSQH
jgi:choline dehydrogenase